MIPYEVIRLVKFAGVLMFVGGAVASLLARDLADRRAAVHRVGSLGLLFTWVGGYLLADALMRPLREPWLLAGFGSSFALQGVLTWSVSIEGRRNARVVAVVVALLVASLCVMVWRPTWAMLGLR